MKNNNYEFHVGDEVETVDGMVGKIVSICHCEKCAERGFFEPKWETADGKYSDYITVYQANCDFPGYHRIGEYVWDHDTNKETFVKHCEKENKEMKEIKLTIDGKEVQLTDEQMKALGFEPDNTKHSPFTRVQYGKNYFVAGDRCAELCEECNDEVDDDFYNNANYFIDENFAHQVALHQLLYRKLLKFAYEQGYEDVAEWDGYNAHYRIHYTYGDNKFNVASNDIYKIQCAVYFATRNDAECAIKEVIEPFMKKYPEFKW